MMQGFNERDESQGLANANLKKVSVALAALMRFMTTLNTNIWETIPNKSGNYRRAAYGRH